MSELKGKCVIVRHDHRFLAADLKNWVTTDGTFYVGDRNESLATVKALPVALRTAGLYIVTDYGYTTESWWQLSPAHGHLELLEAPPALLVGAGGIV